MVSSCKKEVIYESACYRYHKRVVYSSSMKPWGTMHAEEALKIDVGKSYYVGATCHSDKNDMRW